MMKVGHSYLVEKQEARSSDNWKVIIRKVRGEVGVIQTYHLSTEPSPNAVQAIGEAYIHGIRSGKRMGAKELQQKLKKLLDL